MKRFSFAALLALWVGLGLLSACFEETVAPPKPLPEPIWKRIQPFNRDASQPFPLRDEYQLRLIDFNYAPSQPAYLCWLSFDVLKQNEEVTKVHIRYEGQIGKDTTQFANLDGRPFRFQFKDCTREGMRVEISELPSEANPSLRPKP